MANETLEPVKRKSWKTTTSGITGILASLAAIGSGLTAEPINFDVVWGGVTGVVASLAILGIGGKLQSLLDHVKKQ